MRQIAAKLKVPCWRKVRFPLLFWYKAGLGAVIVPVTVSKHSVHTQNTAPCTETRPLNEPSGFLRLWWSQLYSHCHQQCSQHCGGCKNTHTELIWNTVGSVCSGLYGLTNHSWPGFSGGTVTKRIEAFRQRLITGAAAPVFLHVNTSTHPLQVLRRMLTVWRWSSRKGLQNLIRQRQNFYFWVNFSFKG